MFFTRIRVPKSTRYSDDVLNRASLWFPLVGWIVGAVVAAVAALADWRLTPLVAAVLSTAAGLLLTGAFHEDGLADAADGFGASRDPTRILAIMKDSRIGTYGAAALTLALMLKVACVAALLDDSGVAGLVRGGHPVLLLVIAHALSRTTSIALLATLPYVRADLDAKAKPLATRLSPARLAGVIVLGVLPIAVVGASWRLLVVPVVAVGVHLSARSYLLRRLGGYTGDCLGATQQIAELAIYVTILALRSGA